MTRITDDWRVGLRFAVIGTPIVGQCVSVTPWGNGRIRWVRLMLPSGDEKSYAPSHLRLVTP